MIRFILLFLTVLIISCNTKGPAIADFKSVSGYVITNETCRNTPEIDDWLLDLSYMTNPPIGDSITIDGVHYDKVVKLKGLSPKLQKPGLPVVIDYNIASSGAIEPQHCENPNPRIFRLLQITVLYQFEIR